MIKVALTGGIGTGKTFISSIFEKLGIPVFNSDLAAKELMNNNITVKEKLISYFGNSIFDNNDMLIRSKLASLIFNNPDALSYTNSIVHPAVRAYFAQWAAKQQTKYVIQESAIVFESGIKNLFDKIITITASKEVRIQRLKERGGLTEEEILRRMNNQIEEENYICESDFIIRNDGSQLILPQIINIHSTLL